jgi:hypothetical protein
MKRILLLIAVLPLFVFGQVKSFTTQETFFDTYIVSNGTQAITGDILNDGLVNYLLDNQPTLEYDTTRAYLVGQVAARRSGNDYKLYYCKANTPNPASTFDYSYWNYFNSTDTLWLSDTSYIAHASTEIDFNSDMYIASDGKIRINYTGADSSQLSIGRNATIGTITSPTVGNSTLRVKDNAFNMYFDGNTILTDGNLQIGTSANSNIVLATNGGNAMRIDSTQKVNLKSGTDINEFSTDGTLAGNSDDAVPTEKAVKTYVDGLGGSIIYSSTTSMDSTQVKALSSSPVTLISAQGAGTAIDIISVVFFYDHNTTEFLGRGNQACYLYHGSASNFTGFSITFGTGDTSDKLKKSGVSVVSPTVYDNQDIIFQASSGDYTFGNGSLKCFITYKVITL